MKRVNLKKVVGVLSVVALLLGAGILSVAMAEKPVQKQKQVKAKGRLTSVEVHNKLRQIKKKRGNIDNLDKQLRIKKEILEFYPDSPEAKDAPQRIRKLKKALKKEIEKVFQEKVSNYEALLKQAEDIGDVSSIIEGLSETYLEFNKPQKLIAWLQRFIKQNPKYANYGFPEYYTALAYLKLHKVDEAVKHALQTPGSAAGVPEEGQKLAKLQPLSFFALEHQQYDDAIELGKYMEKFAPPYLVTDKKALQKDIRMIQGRKRRKEQGVKERPKIIRALINRYKRFKFPEYDSVHIENFRIEFRTVYKPPAYKEPIGVEAVVTYDEILRKGEKVIRRSSEMTFIKKGGKWQTKKYNY